jgi:hypothetical protein
MDKVELRGWLEYFHHSKPISGGGDILCAGWTDPLSAAAGFAATVSGLVKEGKEPLYIYILVIFPPGALSSQSYEDLVESFFSILVDYVSQDFADHGATLKIGTVEAALRRRIKIKVSKDQHTSSLTDILSRAPASTAVFVIDAETYSPKQESTSQGDLTVTPPAEGIRVHLDEDLWVRSLHYSASELMRIAVTRNLFVLFFAQTYEPYRDENLKLLHSIENCALVFAEPPEGVQRDNSVLMHNVDRWLDLAREQRVDEVVQEIEGAGLTPINRALVKAQCLMQAGRPLLSFEMIEPFLDRVMGGDNPQLMLTVARIASEAGHHSSALELLRAALRNNLTNEFELNAALKLAKTLGVSEEGSQALERLALLYPDSRTAILHRLNLCRDKDDYKRFAEELASRFDVETQGGEILYLHLLANEFSAEAPDYDNLVRNVVSKLPSYRDRVVLASAAHAARRGLFSTAAKLCLSEEWQEEIREDVVWRVISILEGLFLMKQENQTGGDPRRGIEQFPFKDIDGLIRQSIIFILNHLLNRPGDGSVRTALFRALSAEMSGLGGIFYLTSIVREAPPPDVSKSEGAGFDAEPLPIEEFTHLYEAVLSQLPKPLVIGVGQLPPLETRYPLDRFLKSITSLLWHTSQKTIVDDSDVNFIYLLLHIAILLSREIGMEYQADLIGIAATGLCTSGNYQAARNLAELCLQLASPSTSKLRIREAWLRYTDIYLRCHSPFEALIGLSCALQGTGISLSPDYRYHELMLICRCLRDLRLFPYALSIIPLAREQAPLTANPRQALSHLEHAEFGLRLQFVTWKGSGLSSEDKVSGLTEIGKRTLELHRKAKAADEEILPTALLLAQINQHLVDDGHLPDEELRVEIEGAATLVEGRQADILRAFASAEPTVETIRTLAWALPDTRYTEDLGTDVTMITLLARRALSGVAKTDDAQAALYLIEWLTNLSVNSAESAQFTRSSTVSAAERAISTYVEAVVGQREFLPSKEELSILVELDKGADPSRQVQESRYPISAQELTHFMTELSLQGVDIYSLGVASNDSLVRVSAVAGEGSLSIEAASVFDVGAHDKWAEQYPYGYSQLDVHDLFGLNAVEQSLNYIGITAEGSGNPMMLIPDVRLQNIPPNLLLVNGRIAGFDRPMASAPSLTWLQSVRTSKRPWKSRYYAWIPASDKPEDILGRLSEELTDTLAEHQFVTSRDPMIPAEMRDLDIAILGAHGGIHGVNEWFRVVADERSTRLSARDIAGSLRGSGVVILFVCSGGRLDRHPYASASVGLPHLLLDHGCRTVVASPWPLDIRAIP